MKFNRFFSLSLLNILLWTGATMAIARSKCPTMGPRLTAQQYCDKYAEMARDQMRRHGVPASITLAQGMLESGFGSSYLAVVANNHFGIKAYSRGWTGAVERCDDDAQDEPFCKFASVQEGYEYHSTFLLNNSRYARLFSYNIKDYKKWANGLKECGYATNPNYGKLLIDLIEKNKLYEYDNLNYSIGNIRNLEGMHTVYKSSNDRSGMKYIRCKEGDDLRMIAREFDINVKKLMRNNDLMEGYVPREGDILYLQNKKSKAHKGYDRHVVVAGESMWMISQMYGVKISSLMKRNKLKSAAVYEGQVLKLR